MGAAIYESAHISRGTRINLLKSFVNIYVRVQNHSFRIQTSFILNILIYSIDYIISTTDQ